MPFCGLAVYAPACLPCAPVPLCVCCCRRYDIVLTTPQLASNLHTLRWVGGWVGPDWAVAVAVAASRGGGGGL